MKKLLLIAGVALSLVSCAIKNTYRVMSVDQYPHNYITLVQTTTDWNVGSFVVIDSHSFIVMGVRDIEIVCK